MRRIAVALSLLLVAVGTFPWDLQDHAHWDKVAWVPLASGIVRPVDMLGNLLLYLPLGFTLQVGDARDRRWVAAGVAVLVAVLLELAQVWSHARFPSATDGLMNVAGGVAGAVWARRRTPDPPRE